MNCSPTGGIFFFLPEVYSRRKWTHDLFFPFFLGKKMGVRALDGARTHDLRFRVVPTKLLFSAIRLIFRHRLVLIISARVTADILYTTQLSRTGRCLHLRNASDRVVLKISSRVFVRLSVAKIARTGRENSSVFDARLRQPVTTPPPPPPCVSWYSQRCIHKEAGCYAQHPGCQLPSRQAHMQLYTVS